MIEKSEPKTPDGQRWYTRWSDVPDGLYTQTQLGQMDPPRKPLPDAMPRARALYHGNRYAPLYHLDDSTPKRRQTPAQRAAALASLQLRHVCRWCGHTDDFEPLGRGRLCDRCHLTIQAWSHHENAVDQAARYLRMPGLVALGVESAPGLNDQPYATRIVLVRGDDDQVAADITTHRDAGHDGDRAALDQIGAALTDCGAYRIEPPAFPGGGEIHVCDVVTWGYQHTALVSLFNPWTDPDNPSSQWNGLHEALPWFRIGGCDVRSAYAPWFGQPYPSQPWPRVDVQYDLPIPGATGDAVDDARAILRTCRAIVDRTEPVSPDAPWHGLDLEDPAVRAYRSHRTRTTP